MATRRLAQGAGRPGAAAAAAGAAPRWPYLRSKALSEELAHFLASAPTGPPRPRRLWVTGSHGSGAGTAVQAALQRAGASAGTSAAASAAAADGSCVAVVFDCTDFAAGGGRRLADFEDALRSQIAAQLKEAAEPARLIEAAVEAVVEKHPEAPKGIAAALEAAGKRAGLPGALPQGTELPGWMEMLERNRTARCPVKLVADAAAAVSTAAAGLGAGGKQQVMRPATTLYAALALLREAGARAGGGPLAPAAYLLTAAEGVAAASGRDVVLVLLRSESLAQHRAGQSLERALEEQFAGEGPARGGAGTLRLLVQTRDAVASVRAHEAGQKVLTADEWSEEMAKAILQPRFLEAEDAGAWRAVWAAVGGHPAHLRRLAELLVSEHAEAQASARRTEQERILHEQTKRALPDRGPDAEAYAKLTEEQENEDSLRHDARGPKPSPAEELLRRLPEAMSGEVAECQKQVEAFSQHPLLGGLRDAAGDQVPAAVRRVCEAASVPAPAGGFGSLQDPVLLALLDVGLLAPKWAGGEGPRLVLSNRLAKSVLLAWAEAREAELPWRQRAASQWRLLRSGGQPAGA